MSKPFHVWFFGISNKMCSESLRHTHSPCAVGVAVPLNCIRFMISTLWPLWLKIIKQILDLTLYPLWDLDESSDFQALHSNKFECRVLNSCSYFTGSVLRKNNKNLLSFKVKHQILRQSQKHWSIIGIFWPILSKNFTKKGNTSVYHKLNWFFKLEKSKLFQYIYFSFDRKPQKWTTSDDHFIHHKVTQRYDISSEISIVFYFILTTMTVARNNL